MSLQEPEKKMSKSDTNVNNFVLITDPRDVIIKKFKKAVTDSGAEIRYDENEKPGISNLINIYASVKDISRQDVEKEFEGGRYGDFKKAVGEAVADTLAPIQERYAEFISDRTYLDSILRRNAQIASGKAEETVREVYEKVGFILK